MNHYYTEILGSLSFFVVFVIFVFRRSKGNFREYGFNLCAVKPILVSIAIGAILVIFSTLISNQIAGKGHPLNDNALIVQVLIYWLLKPITEEIFFRGWLQTIISKRVDSSISISTIKISYAVIFTSLIFGIFHGTLYFSGMNGYKVITMMLFVTILGLFTGYYREKTNSLFPSIVNHISYNALGGIIANVL